MRVKTGLVLPTLLLLCASMAMAQVDVTVDHDESVDFSTYTTYAWMPNAGTPAPEFDEVRIRRAVETQLEASGLSQAAGDPTLWVVTHASVGQALQISSTNTGYVGYGRRGWGGGWGATTVNVREVPVGTLVVDLVDNESDKLVWRGIASGTIPAKAEKSEKKINKAARKLFKKFPPASVD